MIIRARQLLGNSRYLRVRTGPSLIHWTLIDRVPLGLNEEISIVSSFHAFFLACRKDSSPGTEPTRDGLESYGPVINFVT